jgi:hypothetical protein
VARTGADIFGEQNAPLYGLLADANEIRVLLTDPFSPEALRRAEHFPPERVLDSLQDQVLKSVRLLEGLRRKGKRIYLKFRLGRAVLEGGYCGRAGLGSVLSFEL